ncbi:MULTISPECIES: hypothetical protein [unclassified Streptomyces]
MNNAILIAAEGKEPVTGTLLYVLIGIAILFAIIIAVRFSKRR